MLFLMLARRPKTEILAKQRLRYSGMTERDSKYDKRTVFDCDPGACASGHYGAHDNFHRHRSRLAPGGGGAHPPPRSEAHERATEFRAEPRAVGLLGSVSLARFWLRALPHSGSGRPEPGAATASRLRRHPAHEPDRRKCQCPRRSTGPA